jgi:hypothetical protein
VGGPVKFKPDGTQCFIVPPCDEQLELMSKEGADLPSTGGDGEGGYMIGMVYIDERAREEAKERAGKRERS